MWLVGFKQLLTRTVLLFEQQNIWNTSKEHNTMLFPRRLPEDVQKHKQTVHFRLIARTTVLSMNVITHAEFHAEIKIH